MQVGIHKHTTVTILYIFYVLELNARFSNSLGALFFNQVGAAVLGCFWMKEGGLIK